MAEWAQEVSVTVEEDALHSAKCVGISSNCGAPIKAEYYEIEIKQEPWDFRDGVGPAAEEAAFGESPLEDAGRIKQEPWDIIETDDGVWTTRKGGALKIEPNEKEEKHPPDATDTLNTRPRSAQTDYGNASHHENHTSAHHIKTQGATWTESENVAPAVACKQPQTPCPRSGDKGTFQEKPKTLKSVEPKITLQCDHCSYSSTVRRYFIRHMGNHTREKLIKCMHCSYTCGRQCDLSMHIKIHSGEKPYKCSECSYSSIFVGNLNRHIKTHTGEKPYKCPQCSYRFARKGVLINHIRTHTGEKPYKCSQCSYSSSHKSNFNNHIRTHTGEKPYKCSECSYSCIEKRNLYRHIKTHAGENTCSISASITDVVYK